MAPVYRWKTAAEGFKTTQEPPPRKDFSIFMQLKIIGASKGFETSSNQGTKQNNVAGQNTLSHRNINEIFVSALNVTVLQLFHFIAFIHLIYFKI